ncbi:MAG: biopolymer transporter ExbD [Puniceicoccales bacterium]|jgi:biopolymer transport protein ExbD|nr:biopolymer transporter ExbD [Puniceicoccales bacterium]
MRPPENKRGGDLGFQLAPMIDVVFVIMLFFMVMAGAVKVEFELKIKLPGEPTPAAEAQDLPDELIISVAQSGQVAINGDNVDTPTSELKELLARAGRSRENAENAKNKLLIVLEAEETARWDRIIQVLDTLALAKASENVTFSVGDGDGL